MLRALLPIAAIAPCCAVAEPLRPPVEPACISSDGSTTLYAHLGNLVPAIAEGKRGVAVGEPLGHIARTGVTYGTHLFFAVLRGGAAVDPEPLLGVPRCR